MVAVAVIRVRKSKAKSPFVKARRYVGATDEIGREAVEVVHPIKGLHTKILHLLGLDDTKLTFFHGGRLTQLSQAGSEVISEIIA